MSRPVRSDLAPVTFFHFRKRDLVWLLIKSLLGLALLSACGPAREYHGATSFSPEERASIESAFATMQARTGGESHPIVWDDGDDGDNRILREHPRDAGENGLYAMSSDSYARTIYLDPPLTGNALRVVAMHEIGHAYGLVHHDGAGLMNPAAQDAWTPADIDVCHGAELCK